MFEPRLIFVELHHPGVPDHTEHNSSLARPPVRTYAASKISRQEDFKHACVPAASLPPM